jgi:hypothetical protein
VSATVTQTRPTWVTFKLVLTFVDTWFLLVLVGGRSLDDARRSDSSQLIDQPVKKLRFAHAESGEFVRVP